MDNSLFPAPLQGQISTYLETVILSHSVFSSLGWAIQFVNYALQGHVL